MFRYLTGFGWGLFCSTERKQLGFICMAIFFFCMTACLLYLVLADFQMWISLPAWQKWCCSAILRQSWKRSTTLPQFQWTLLYNILMWGSYKNKKEVVSAVGCSLIIKKQNIPSLFSNPVWVSFLHLSEIVFSLGLGWLCYALLLLS